MEVRGKGREGLFLPSEQMGAFSRVVKSCEGGFGLSRISHPREHSTTALFLHPTVISRNILTHKDITENWETPEVESRLGGPPGARSANGSTKTLLEKMGVKTGPSGHTRTMPRADEM